MTATAKAEPLWQGAPDDVSVFALHRKRDRLLVALEQGGPQTAEQLAHATNMTGQQVRDHYSRLKQDGCAFNYRQRDSNGKPSHNLPMIYEAMP